MSDEDRRFIKSTIERFYGPYATVRSFGPDPARLELHIEADCPRDMRMYDCLGVLMTRLDRVSINLELTPRGTKIRGLAKIAYRQGVVL